MNKIRESFASDNQIIDEPKIETPLDISRSRFTKASQQKKILNKRLESKAQGAHEEILSRKEKMFSLTRQFMMLLKDTNLPENKGPSKKAIEKSVLDDLAQFAMQINAEEDFEPEDPDMPLPPRKSMGSISMIMLLFKAAFQLRDSNNQLSFLLDKMYKEKLDLEDRVEELEKKLSMGGTANEKK